MESDHKDAQRVGAPDRPNDGLPVTSLLETGVTELSEIAASVESFLADLCSHYIEIEEIWWIGSRANGVKVRPDSDWDFLVFTKGSVRSRIEVDKELQIKAAALKIDLLIENEPRVLKSVWGPVKTLRLDTDLRWNAISDTKAKYWGLKLKQREQVEALFQDEWQRYFAEHGADIDSEDISTWMYGTKVFPSK